ncbi:hypothetical protein PG994_001013 [Apiospora phragmitis]|uniref:Uncharacterized protein n=1 Tax=Apiospora phragmitis TaxID=2905665 RepID=A0ABR1WR73_9PEZI
MAGSNDKNAEKFRLCYFADAYYGSHPGWTAGDIPPTVFEVPHEPDSRFVLTLEVKTSLSGPNADTSFCIGQRGEKEDGAALTGYIDAAFVLTERAAVPPPGGPWTEITTEAVYSQQLTHRHDESDYANMMARLRDDAPAAHARGVLFGAANTNPSAGDMIGIVAQVEYKLLGLLYRAVGNGGKDETGEVVGSTSVDGLEKDFNACMTPFTYEVYLDVLSGAIDRLRAMCQDYENQDSTAEGTE